MIEKNEDRDITEAVQESPPPQPAKNNGQDLMSSQEEMHQIRSDALVSALKKQLSDANWSVASLSAEITVLKVTIAQLQALLKQQE
jgi:hypothetical protein